MHVRQGMLRASVNIDCGCAAAHDSAISQAVQEKLFDQGLAKEKCLIIIHDTDWQAVQVTGETGGRSRSNNN